MSEYAMSRADEHVGTKPEDHLTDGMQLSEFIGEVSSLYAEGAVKSDDVKFVLPDGMVYVPIEVVYDGADDSAVVKLSPFVEV